MNAGFRRWPTLTAAALGVLLSGARALPADAWMTAPAVPAPVAVPAGAKLVAHFHATGAQVYTCGPAPTGGAFAWTLKQPDAKLTDAKGKPAGTHGAGPSWTSTDGSSITAKKVAQADAPAPGAVPWLLLHVEHSTGMGLLSPVTHVQRVATKGGTAPTAKCDASAAGSEKRVDYSAEYYFFAAGAAK
jgi:hypothetical protein